MRKPFPQITMDNTLDRQIVHAGSDGAEPLENDDIVVHLLQLILHRTIHKLSYDTPLVAITGLLYSINFVSSYKID